MEGLTADILVHVISYLNIKDSSRFNGSCKRIYYLVHNYQNNVLGIELTTTSFSKKKKKAATKGDKCRHDHIIWSDGEDDNTYRKCLDNLRTKPNFALSFENSPVDRRRMRRNSNESTRQYEFSPLTAVHVKSAGGIQANYNQRVEYESDIALMMGRFPSNRTQIVPFKVAECINGDNSGVDNVINTLKSTREKMSEEGGDDDANFWKVFIVYVCGESGYLFADSFLSDLQTKYPNSAIVGGVCEEGYVTTEFTKDFLKNKSRKDLFRILEAVDYYDNDKNGKMNNTDEKSAESSLSYLKDDELIELIHDLIIPLKQHHIFERIMDGFFGLALGGDVPIRTIVSRGVKSVTGGSNSSISVESSPWIVHESELTKPGDASYMLGESPWLQRPMHIIRSLKEVSTGKVVSPYALFTNLTRQPEFLGIRRNNTDVYELHEMQPYSLLPDSILLTTDGHPDQQISINGTEIDMFAVNSEISEKHLDCTLKELKEQTINETILGGIMFSCKRRGMFEKEMTDAHHFAKYFPDVPLCGFYANGEIGPMATVGDDVIKEKSINQNNGGRRRRIVAQSSTAVFALFVVPPPPTSKLSNTFDFLLEDSEENIQSFFNKLRL